MRKLLLVLLAVLLSATTLVSCLKDTFGDIDYGQLTLKDTVYHMPCNGTTEVPVYYGSKRFSIAIDDPEVAQMTVRTYSDIYVTLWDKGQTASIILKGRGTEGQTHVRINDLRTKDSVSFRLVLTAARAEQ